MNSATDEIKRMTETYNGTFLYIDEPDLRSMSNEIDSLRYKLRKTICEAVDDGQFVLVQNRENPIHIVINAEMEDQAEANELANVITSYAKTQKKEDTDLVLNLYTKDLGVKKFYESEHKTPRKLKKAIKTELNTPSGNPDGLKRSKRDERRMQFGFDVPTIQFSSPHFGLNTNFGSPNFGATYTQQRDPTQRCGQSMTTRNGVQEITYTINGQPVSESHYNQNCGSSSNSQWNTFQPTKTNQRPGPQGSPGNQRCFKLFKDINGRRELVYYFEGRVVNEYVYNQNCGNGQTTRPNTTLKLGQTNNIEFVKINPKSPLSCNLLEDKSIFPVNKWRDATCLNKPTRKEQLECLDRIREGLRKSCNRFTTTTTTSTTTKTTKTTTTETTTTTKITTRKITTKTTSVSVCKHKKLLLHWKN